MTNFTPKKSKQIALARLDIVYQWLEFRKNYKNKLQADYDFVKLHNTSDSHLFEILGKISRGSLSAIVRYCKDWVLTPKARKHTLF